MGTGDHKGIHLVCPHIRKSGILGVFRVWGFGLIFEGQAYTQNKRKGYSTRTQRQRDAGNDVLNLHTKKQGWAPTWLSLHMSNVGLWDLGIGGLGFGVWALGIKGFGI